MFDIKCLKEEFATLQGQIKSTLDAGNVNAETKAMNDKKFARMEEIKQSLDATKAMARFAIENGLTDDFEIAPTPLNRGTAQFKSFDNCPVLFGKDSAVKAMKLQPTRDTVNFGSLLRAVISGPQNESERFAVANSTDGTGIISVDALQSAVLIDAMRASSAFVAAGVGVLPFTNQNRLAVLSTDPGSSWRADGDAVTTTESFTGVQLTPKNLEIIVKINRELIQDAINPQAFQDAVSRAMAQAVDLAIGFGAGGTAPTGISGTSGIEAVTASTNGDDLEDYSKFVEGIFKIQTNGYNPTGVILSARESKAVNNLVDTTGQPLRRPPVLETLPFFPVKGVPITQTQGSSTNASTMLVGDFSKVVVAVRSPLTFELMRETYAGNFQYGLLCHLRMDVGVANPKALAKITGIIPA